MRAASDEVLLSIDNSAKFSRLVVYLPLEAPDPLVREAFHLIGGVGILKGKNSLTITVSAQTYWLLSISNDSWSS